MKNEPASVLSLLARARKPSTPLLDALNDYDRLQRKRFHVPAHAGQDLTGTDLFKDPFRFDLTEVEGLDVLSEPSECLLEAQEAAAKAFGVSRTFFLVNGASVGLQAALLSVLKPGEKVLVARNAHRSVLGGLILLDAQPAWFLPEQLQAWGLRGAVRLETLQNAYRNNPDAKAVVLTSPTYEGIGSDIESIAAWCRETGLFLIVDEAHGSLWPFSDQLPVSACTFPCDAVIHSLHKSGGQPDPKRDGPFAAGFANGSGPLPASIEHVANHQPQLPADGQPGRHSRPAGIGRRKTASSSFSGARQTLSEQAFQSASDHSVV
jgi:arginine/lysine/ornithine decarboxylase